MLEKPFTSYLLESISKNWEITALSDFNGESFTYQEVGTYIMGFHQLFKQLSIQPGDKIAITGKNSARWGILYIAVVTYGAVVVPVLPDFKKDDLKMIIDHSEAVMLFADDALLKILMDIPFDKVHFILKIDDFSLTDQSNADVIKAFNESNVGLPVEEHLIKKDDFKVNGIPNDQLAVLSYTSGTTGFTKGVMLLHNSLAANIRFAQNNMPLEPGDRIVSLLPLAHTFGCAFEFLFPFTLGCQVTILTKTPSPQVVMKAFQEVKPALVLSVPLVIEKIFKSRVLPVISKWHMKVLLALPGINQIIYKKFREKLSDFFGGNFHELILGGAPFSHEAESFFRKIKFNYTVGYGMTECGPLISYNKWNDLPMGSCGKIVDTLEIKIEKESPNDTIGEICVRGDNVMMGYFKNEEDTKKVLDKDGWLHTGDLGYIDDHDFIHIRGRSKSMILGPSGKNIYPEEVESMINNKYGISESVVVERGDKLVALVYPDPEIMKKEKLDEENLKKLLEHHRKNLNHKFPKHIRLSAFEIHDKEFVKTPKRNIKRFLYQ